MPTILVPAPPKSAFNKNRPVSDLLQHQLKHFRHIEARLPNELHSGMTARDLHTENGAAQYIAHITEALKSLHQVSAPAAPSPIPIRRRAAAARPGRAFDIAAAATTQNPKSSPARTLGQPPTANLRTTPQAPQTLSSRPKRSEVEGPASSHRASHQPPLPKAPKSKPRSKKP